MWNKEPPFGVSDFKEEAALRYRAGVDKPLVKTDFIQCCIKGCDRWIKQRHRGEQPKYCPDHGISMSRSPTYVYENKLRNILVRGDLFSELVTRGKKVEHWRLGYETSEDALTWNFFVGMKMLDGLIHVVKTMTGLEIDEAPELYLWGNHIDTSIGPWPELNVARSQLEQGLSIPTEPDIAMRVPGKALILIEAKFGSANGNFSKKALRFGSISEFLKRYGCRKTSHDPLNRQWIVGQQGSDILEQLARNVIFANWLATDGERAFVINLVRDDSRNDEVQFRRHLTGDSVEFRRTTWEEMLAVGRKIGPRSVHLQKYLENKSLKLRPAFAMEARA